MKTLNDRKFTVHIWKVETRVSLDLMEKPKNVYEMVINGFESLLKNQ
jgi:hypothetical protein